MFGGFEDISRFMLVNLTPNYKILDEDISEVRPDTF